MKWFRLVGPIGRAIGLIPLVRVFTRAELVESLVRAGFQLDYEWQPGEGLAVFLVAQKPDNR
jgi:hypothetical protein